jgi:hypothetical protein
VDMEGEQRQALRAGGKATGTGWHGYRGPSYGRSAPIRHPCIHSATEHGESKLAKMLVEEFGEDELRAMSSGQDRGPGATTWSGWRRMRTHKAVVFTFFGPSRSYRTCAPP